MKSLRTTFTALCCSLSAASYLHADLVMEQETVSNGQTQTMVMKIKEGKMKTEMGKETTSIMDLKTMDTITLMHGQKMAMKTPGASIKAMQEAAKPKDAPAPKPVKTGKSEKVGEHDCELWTLETAGTKMTFYVAKNYPGYDDLKDEMLAFTKATGGGDGEGWDMGGMVVKTLVNASGITVATEVKSVKKTTLSEDEFKVPADYKELAVPGQ